MNIHYIINTQKDKLTINILIIHEIPIVKMMLKNIDNIIHKI